VIPWKYLTTPSSEPSRVDPLMIIMNTKRTGSGTVIQTIHEELLTPLNTQRKMMIQHERHANKAGMEKIVSSPSSKARQVSSSTILITLIL
jgi:hypothetical protein